MSYTPDSPFNTWEMSDDDPLKEILIRMNKHEERIIMDKSKHDLKDNKSSLSQEYRAVEGFIQNWPRNTRKFYFLNTYLRELGYQLIDEYRHQTIMKEEEEKNQRKAEEYYRNQPKFYERFNPNRQQG